MSGKGSSQGLHGSGIKGRDWCVLIVTFLWTLQSGHRMPSKILYIVFTASPCQVGYLWGWSMELGSLLTNSSSKDKSHNWFAQLNQECKYQTFLGPVTKISLTPYLCEADNKGVVFSLDKQFLLQSLWGAVGCIGASTLWLHCPSRDIASFSAPPQITPPTRPVSVLVPWLMARHVATTLCVLMAWYGIVLV